MRAKTISINMLSLSLAAALGVFSTVGVTNAGAMLIDNVKLVNGSQETSFDQVDVLIDGGKIVSVRDSIEVSQGVTVVNGEGKILTPGLFNADTQIGVVEIGAVSQTNDGSSDDERFTASFRPIDAFNSNTVVIPYNRAQGLTHALVVPSPDASLFAGTVSVIDLSQSESSIQVANAGVAVVLGAWGSRMTGDSRAVALAVVREALEDARDYAAHKEAYNRGARRAHALSRNDLAALVPVVQRRAPLIVYVEQAAEISRVLKFAKTEKISLILVGVSEGWMVADQIAKAQVPVIIDPIRNLPTAYEALGSRLDNAKLMHDAGVRLLFTGMGWQTTHNAYLVRQSAGNAVANGLSYHAAIAAMSSNPAEVFGLDGYGEVVAGAKATAVLWDGDPLEPSSSVEMVLINGQNFHLESRATRLRDRYFDYYKNKATSEQLGINNLALSTAARTLNVAQRYQAISLSNEFQTKGLFDEVSKSIISVSDRSRRGRITLVLPPVVAIFAG